MRTRDKKILIQGDFTPGHTVEVAIPAVDVHGRQQDVELAPRSTILIQGKTTSPLNPTDLSALASFYNIFLSWVNPANLDLKGVEVWRSTTNNRDLAAKIATVTADYYVDNIGLQGETRYYWILAVNTSGGVSEWYPVGKTAGVSATTGAIQATDIDDFAITASKIYTKIPVLDGDSWTDNSPSPNYVTWGSHYLYYNGVRYTITAGNTNKHYIYWKKATSTTVYQTSDTAPTRDDETFIIAVNVSGIHNTAWNSIANQVIGTAYIMNAAITNALIADLAVDNGKLANATIGIAKIDTASVVGLTVTGQINLTQIGSGNLDNISDGATYKKMSSTEQSKLAGIQAGATVGATWGTNISSIPQRFTDTIPPTGSGLQITASYLGFYSSNAWKAYIDSSGNMVLGDITGTNKGLSWNQAGGTLTVQGMIRTAQSGQRMVLDNSDNTLRFFDSAGNNTIYLDDSTALYPGSPTLFMKGFGEQAYIYVNYWNDGVGIINNYSQIFGGGIHLESDQVASISEQSMVVIKQCAVTDYDAIQFWHGLTGASAGITGGGYIWTTNEVRTVTGVRVGSAVVDGYVKAYTTAGPAYLKLTLDALNFSIKSSGVEKITIDATGNIAFSSTQTVDGIDISAHDHTGVAGHGGKITYSDLNSIPSTFASTNHNLVDTTHHPVSGLTSGHFLKATGATTYGFAAHGLTYTDVGAAASSHNHAGSAINSGNIGISYMPTGGTWVLTSVLTIDGNTNDVGISLKSGADLVKIDNVDITGSIKTPSGNGQDKTVYVAASSGGSPTVAITFKMGVMITA